MHGIDLYVATPEDIIIAKLEWAKIGSSERQIEDTASVIKFNEESLDYSYLNTWILKLDLTEQWNAAKKILGSPDEA